VVLAARRPGARLVRPQEALRARPLAVVAVSLPVALRARPREAPPVRPQQARAVRPREARVVSLREAWAAAPAAVREALPR
jgi:hypothetical protein